ncbi:MAG TPA: hypothetical protein VFO74_12690 [Pseudolabrys sp.]|nr:hypothetical protein [Pseudolabrys sp.]
MGCAGPRVQTVCGPLDPEALGPTLMHEHVFCDITPPKLTTTGGDEVEITLENAWDIRYRWAAHLGNHRLNDERIAEAELIRLKKAGGATLVDVTCQGIRPDPLALHRVSTASGVHIVCGCGFYVEEYVDRDWTARDVDGLAATMVRDLRQGMGDTGVKAGIIGEIGCSGRWTEFERRVMHAAVIAQRETGASITIHPPRFPFSPVEIVEFVRAAGGDVRRTIIGHVDRTIFDDGSLFRLADTGCVIEYDFFGIESSYYPFQEEIDLPNDAMRLRAILVLMARGHLCQILMSQDICTRTRLTRWGGHGYGYLFQYVVPAMRRRGFAESDIRVILEETPRRLLTLI